MPETPPSQVITLSELTGDSLSAGGNKINSNFQAIYTRIPNDGMDASGAGITREFVMADDGRLPPGVFAPMERTRVALPALYSTTSSTASIIPGLMAALTSAGTWKVSGVARLVSTGGSGFAAFHMYHPLSMSILPDTVVELASEGETHGYFCTYVTTGLPITLRTRLQAGPGGLGTATILDAGSWVSVERAPDFVVVTP